MRETRTYGLKRQEKENGDRRTARCVKDTHTQPSSAVLFRLTAPSLDPTVGMGLPKTLSTKGANGQGVSLEGTQIRARRRAQIFFDRRFGSFSLERRT